MPKSLQSTRQPSAWIWGSLAGILVFCALILRPILPIDETRYISVAWDMWLSGDYLVPHLNGANYSHKPPLLFWLINAGWGVFGVNEIWPRLVAPVFGFGCLIITSLLGRRLYPGTQVYFLAPLLLVGCFYWGIYSTLTMFDLILTFWSLVGIYGLILVWGGKLFRGWILFGCAIGLGILSKGPVVLIFLLPSALFGPYWAKSQNGSIWLKWYIGLMMAVLLGTIIALTWAMLAGQAGGDAYKEALFWGQSAGRIVQSFAHKKPFWWYLVILPGLLLPWVVWPTMLKSIWRLIREYLSTDNWKAEPRMRHALVWVLSPLVIMSIISGKQPHYLLPLFPAFALSVSALVTKTPDRDMINGRWDMAPMTVMAVLLGITITIHTMVTAAIGKPEYSESISPFWSIPIIASGLILIFKPQKNSVNRAISISIFSGIIVLTIHLIAYPRLNIAYDLKPLAKRLAISESQGYTIANMDKYHGQYNFLGRLTKPLIFTDSKLLEGWLKENPKSKVISYHYNSPEKHDPEYFQAYRGRYVAIWDAAKLRINPKLAFRESD